MTQGIAETDPIENAARRKCLTGTVSSYIGNQINDGVPVFKYGTVYREY